MHEFADAAKAGGRNTTIFGVIAIMLGILAMLTPGLTGISVVLIVGVFVVAGGIVRMIWAFKAGSLGKGLLMFAIGGLTLLCGLALVANPLFGTGFLTIVLAAYFVIDGIFETVGGSRLRPEPVRPHDLGAVPALWGMGHWHPAGHQVVLRRPDHGYRRFIGGR